MDLSVIQLESPHTSQEELQSLYFGSPLGEPELMEEVVSSFDDHQGWKQSRAPETATGSQPMDV